MRLLLARHGEMPSNTRRLLDTAMPGDALTAKGRVQAEELARLMIRAQPVVVVASPMTRATQTASIVAQACGLHVLIRNGVREIDAGDLDLRGDEEAISRYRAVTFAWAAGELDARMPGAGDGHDMLTAFDEVITEVQQQVKESERPALVVSHGAAIRTWVASRASNIDVDALSDRTLPNTGLAELTGDQAVGWQLTSWAGSPMPTGEGNR